MTRVQKIHFLLLPPGEIRASENYIGEGFKFSIDWVLVMLV
jgi:hypothetical protein